MGISGLVSLVLIGVTCYISYKGFNSSNFFAKLEFEVEKITLYRDYKRLITSGFVHINWQHLLFNMFALFIFGLSFPFGPVLLLAVYFASQIGGNLVALVIHRNDASYSSVGSSGAINGIIFASIVRQPNVPILFLPGWLFGLAFIILSIYGIRSKKRNIGHEAHLGGALTGMILAICFYPASLWESTLPLVLMFLPTVAFIIIIVTKPSLLFVDNFWYTHNNYNYTVDDRYNAQKRNSQQEVDRILDKINQKGINSLSKRERESLEEYSRK